MVHALLAEGERPSSAATIPLGTLVADRYRVDAVLGEGGMGVVYLAEHIHIRKRLALKVLLPQWASTPEVVARFEQEAVAAGAISHPNVTSASDFGRLPDGSFFLVLEYLEGRTLRSELEAGALAPARALGIARGIALGMAAAHATGIVHRDLKPENVMLVTRDGDPDFVKVLDFGIARVEHRGGEGGKALTSAGAVLGTPQYMAPEQALGNAIDARTDLYTLGVMLFEMLTGDCPFRGSAVALLQQHLLAPAPPLPPAVGERVPFEVQALLARLLAKEPAARPANATEVAVALHESLLALRASGPRIVVSNGAVPSAARAATQWLRAQASEGAATKQVARVAAWLRSTAAPLLSRASTFGRERPKVTWIAGSGVAVAVTLVLIASTSSHRAAPAPSLAATATTVAPVATQTQEEEALPSASDASFALLEGKFADRIEQGQPSGDARGIAATRRAFYWVDFTNRGRPTRVSLVWTIDGKEVQRQTLHIGRAPHWRTWGTRAVGDGHEIEVQVLDGAGKVLKEDAVTLDG